MSPRPWLRKGRTCLSRIARFLRLKSARPSSISKTGKRKRIAPEPPRSADAPRSIPLTAQPSSPLSPVVADLASAVDHHCDARPCGLFPVDFDRGETVLEESDSLPIAATWDNTVWLERYKSGSSRVIKQGVGVLPEEAEVTHWVRTNTLVPVPQVMHVTDKRSTPRIEFEYIDGAQLDEAWPTLAASERETIADELARAIKAMQDAPLPASGLIGSYQRLRAAPFRPDAWPDWPPYTPTSSMTEFFDWARRCALTGGISPTKWDSEIAPHIRFDSRIVLTHGDLFPRNILVRDGHLAAIIDWELAGWWPEEVEAAIVMQGIWRHPADFEAPDDEVEACWFVAECITRARYGDDVEVQDVLDRSKRREWAKCLLYTSTFLR